MHEFLLFGQVANENRQMLLQQLAGVTRMHPRHVTEWHFLFRSKLPPGLGTLPSGGGTQGVLQPELQKTKSMLNSSLYYLQLVCEVDKTDFEEQNENLFGRIASNGDAANDVSTKHDSGKTSSGAAPKKWRLEFRDVPDAGKQAVTSRLMSRTPIESGDPFVFMDNLGFEYISQYMLEGEKFYDQDVTLFVSQVLHLPQTDNQVKFTLESLPRLAGVRPFDNSRTYLLQASNEATDGNNPDLREKAVQQLMSMKETLKQAVNLAPGDRLALDTKVSSRSSRPLI